MIFLYLLLLLIVGLVLNEVINRIGEPDKESFTVNYVPTENRNITQNKPSNLNELITNPVNEYKTTLKDWKDYKRIQTDIMESNEIEGSSSTTNAKVAADLRWRIHRWSIWDFLPSLNYPYYCMVRQFNGEEVCQPITDDTSCRVGKVFKNPTECLQKLMNQSKKQTNTKPF
jgi:hypothetical protein